MKIDDVLIKNKGPIDIAIRSYDDYYAALKKYGEDTKIISASSVNIKNPPHRYDQLQLDFTGAKLSFRAVNIGLISFKNFPIECTDLDINSNSFENLKGLPTRNIHGSLNCSSNRMTSLEGCPSVIGGDFNCIVNNLTTLKGGPKVVGGDYFCKENKLTSLEGVAEEVKELYAMHNKINTLINISKQLKKCTHIDLTGNVIQDGGLGLLLVEGLEHVETAMCGKPFKDAIVIITKYLVDGRAGILECQEELIDAGLERFAIL